MGQYYKPVVLTETNEVENWWNSHDFDNGLKLMEHSYVGNYFVQAVVNHLYDNPKRLVWAGDYADEKWYDKASDNEDLKINREELPTDYEPDFIVNHTKGLYVDMNNLPKDADGWCVHPLPLLTCVGNGRGGGDYRIENEYIGTWATDKVEASDKYPEGYEELIPNFEMY